MHSGPPIYDEKPESDARHNHSEFVLMDPCPESFREKFNHIFCHTEMEPNGAEFWLNSLETYLNDGRPDAHTYQDPFDSDDGSFEQGEWIYDHERMFFEYSGSSEHKLEN